MPKPTDIRVRDVRFDTEDYRYRSPIKFGGVALDRVTLLNAHVTVETLAGEVATGFGSMPMGNVWAYPSKTMGYRQTLDAMRAVAAEVATAYAGFAEAGHPIDITWDVEHGFPALTKTVGDRLKVPDPIPLLATLVSASPFDAALHDAFGKAHGLNCYSTYGPEFMSHDLGHYLGREFAGEHLNSYVSATAQPRMPMYHLVGAIDPLTDAEVTKKIGDGLPDTLGREWIRLQRPDAHENQAVRRQLRLGCGARRLAVNRVAEEATGQTRRARTWVYSLDFNEKCPNRRAT